MKYGLLLGLLALNYNVFASDCLPSATELCDYSQGTFYHLDNQFGLGLLGGTSDTNQGQNANWVGAAANLDFLFTNHIYWANTVNYQYLINDNYQQNMWFYLTKFSYEVELLRDRWSLTPYVAAGIGNNQVFFSSGNPINAGLGLRTEVALTTRNSLYADYNYQWLIDFGDSIGSGYNSYYNTNNASLQGGSNIQYIEAGYKHILNCSTGLSVYYRFNEATAVMNTGNSNVYTNYNSAGINFYWYIGG